jgi:hypothetical protein
MNNSNTKRPSDFALSRYILGECTKNDAIRIESWLCSSPDAKKEFELFKTSIETGEKTTSQVFKRTDSIFTHIFGFPFSQSKIRTSLALCGSMCLLFFTLIFINIHKNESARYTALESTAKTAVFRDTLEALLRLSGHDQIAVLSSAPASDVTQSSVVLPCVASSVPKNLKADRTLLY